MLPARAGFPRKVKPLVRLSERETAAYCIINGIDYVVDECPMAVGNKHIGYKEALNEIELTSPGSKAQFYFNFLRNAAERFADAARAGDDADGSSTLVHCSRCGAPSSSDPCAFCRLVEQATRPDTRPVSISRTRSSSGERPA